MTTPLSVGFDMSIQPDSMREPTGTNEHDDWIGLASGFYPLLSNLRIQFQEVFLHYFSEMQCMKFLEQIVDIRHGFDRVRGCLGGTIGLKIVLQLLLWMS